MHTYIHICIMHMYISKVSQGPCIAALRNRLFRISAIADGHGSAYEARGGSSASCAPFAMSE
jgi:hypothetical protein